MDGSDEITSRVRLKGRKMMKDMKHQETEEMTEVMKWQEDSTDYREWLLAR